MLIENIKLALSSLAANKLRTFLTMLGIIIGIASVIAIMTVGNSQTAENERQLSMFGVNRIECYMWFTGDVDFDDMTDTEQYVPEFKKPMLEAMIGAYPEEIEAVAASSWGGSARATVEGKDAEKYYANGSLVGVNPGYFAVNSGEIGMLEGKVFTAKESEADSYSIIVSDKLVNNLFDGDLKRALGSRIDLTVSGEDADTLYTYTIVGIYRYSSFGGPMDASQEKDIWTEMYIPYKNMQAMSKNVYEKKLNYFTVSVKPGTDVISFTDELQMFLSSQLEEDSNFEIACYNNEEWIEESNRSMRQQVMTTTLIGAIALLVGGIGVMNIMTVSITERTREIGTRKALGAKNGEIRLQFITEAIILSLLGGVIGIAAGVLAGFVICRFVQQIPMVMSAKSIAGSFLVAFAVGVFFGYYPANKAAKMDPIEALRYE